MITARRNNASQAQITSYALSNPFAEGAFRYVAKGHFTDGEREGQACVAKWFKSGSVFADSYFDADIKVYNEAYDIIHRFNSHGFVDKSVIINTPEIWTFRDNASPIAPNGSKCIVEPFIRNYKKFNSNTGWRDDYGAWPQVMQALSHFSYHTTRGQYVLCDLQGGVYMDCVILSDPVILSIIAGTYGPTDLGTDGINSFFSGHVCNQYCSSTWIRPTPRRRVFNPRMGTTMHHVCTDYSRPSSTKHCF